MLSPRRAARAIQQLRARYPAARVTVDEGSYGRLSRELKLGALDVIVEALREPRVSGLVVETELFADPYVIAVRRGHRLALQRHVVAEDLAACDWVVPQRNVPRRTVVDSLLARLTVKPPLVVETSSLSMMTATAVQADFVSFLREECGAEGASGVSRVTA